MTISGRFTALLLLSSLGLTTYAGCSSEDPSSGGMTTDAGTTGVVLDSGSSTTADSGSTADAGPTCTGSKTICGDSCVDLELDRENCGACGKSCGPSEVCSQGSCALTCGGGTTKCGASCVDTKTDEKNCGACGTVCGAGQTCSAGADGGAGACVCGAGFTNCGGVCVDTKADDTNCGACGVVCGTGKECAAGTCEGAISTWLFEGNLLDEAAKNNGTIMGTESYATTSWRQDAGKALSLNGSSAVAVAAPTDLPLGNAPRTIEAWVQATGFNDGTYNGILSYGDRSQVGTGQLLSIRSNRWISSAQWWNDLVQQQGPLMAQAWSHVAYVWDGTNRRLYIDGREVAIDAPAPFSTAAGELRIGATDLSGRYFTGMIDDVRVYGYARTPAQLRKNVDQSISYAFTMATDTTDSGPNKTSLGTKAGGVTATADRKGAADSAIALDGAGGTQFQIFPVSALGKSRAYTVSVWVKPTAAAAGTIVHTSVEQNGGPGDWCISMLGLDTSGKPVATSWAPGTVAATADDAVAADTWTHLATTYSDGSLKLYVNGVLKKTAVQAAYASSSRPTYVTLGTANNGTNCSGHSLMNANFTGAVDDFKVFDRELSAAEIANEAQ